MTPGELLAAAADRLDALVANASDGPWEVGSHYDMLYPDRPSWFLDGVERWRGMTNNVNVGEDEGTARYIAAMNPLVGKALATMLRTFANEYVRETRHFHEMWNEAARVRMIGDRFPGFAQALELARIIVGGA